MEIAAPASASPGASLSSDVSSSLKSAWKLPTQDQLNQLNNQRSPTLQPDPQSDKKSKAAKDLSHVPCKFFKAGSCTAGPSCPFSHGLSQPGTSKPICQWYAKGSCKFGHKCALAHILPGQTMAMDRKNKRAAQAAARGEGAGPTPAEAAAALANSPPPSNGRSSQGGSALARSLKQSNGSSTVATNSNNGKTATFFAGSSSSADSHPSPLSAAAQLQQSGPLPAMPGPGYDEDEEYNPYKQQSPGQQSSLTALSSSLGHSSPTKNTLSPPRMAMPIPANNGPQPGSSSMFGTSPFSGSRALFMPSSYASDSDGGEHFPRSPPAPGRAFHQMHPTQGEPMTESALDTDDDADEGFDEAFLPSSLNDLLTPEERRRRASKAGFGFSGQPSSSVPAEFTLNRAQQPKGPWGPFEPPSSGLSLGRHNASSTSPTATRSLLSNSFTHQPNSPPSVSLLHPLPQGVYSSSFDPSANSARDAWPSASTSPSYGGPGSLPGGLAAGLSTLHLQPAIHSGETPPSAVSLLFGSHPGQSSSLSGRSDWTQAGHTHPAWANSGDSQQQQSQQAQQASLGTSPSRPSPLGPNSLGVLPRRMSSQLSSSVSGYPSPLQQSISHHDSEDVDDIQFEMDG